MRWGGMLKIYFKNQCIPLTVKFQIQTPVSVTNMCFILEQSITRCRITGVRIKFCERSLPRRTETGLV